ncbi:hypothetical protein ACOSQ2_028933 [Xanthoceras sorbifolium]
MVQKYKDLRDVAVSQAAAVSTSIEPLPNTISHTGLSVDMKDKNTTSTLRRILVNCSVQAKEYGGCVAAKVPEVERDMKNYVATLLLYKKV